MLTKAIRRLACFLLSAALLIPLTACDEAEQPNESSSEEVTSQIESVSTTPEEQVQLLDDLGGKYNGRTYTIVTSVESLFSSENDDPLGKAVSARLSLLERSFGIEVKIKTKTEAQIKEGAVAAKENGSHYADLICASAELMAELAEIGVLENTAGLPYMDFNAGYMPKDFITQQKAGNSLYFMSGASTLAMNSAAVLFYDKSVLSKAEQTPISKAVGGSLTWESLVNMASASAKQGVYGIDTALETEELLAAMYVSVGGSFIKNTDSGVSLNYDPATVELVNNVNAALFKADGMAPDRSDDLSFKQSAINDFVAGKTAFLIAGLESVVNISKKKGEWGILPLPKASESQSDYRCAVNDASACVGVPKFCDDSAFAGFMLNAFLAASANGLDEGLRSTYVYYYFWSNDEALMLRLIENSVVYDLGVMYSSLPAVYNVTSGLLAEKDNLTVPEEQEKLFDEFSKRVFK